MTHASTLKALSDITDTGLFERLATSVLREANPIYEPLVHTGINTDGKTVKGPIDGVVFIKASQPVHMISVHHTTGNRDKLKTKWLHDPSTVKHRKSGVKPKGPGDILKTIAIYRDERIRTPDLVGTLVLTITSDPSQELVRETEAIARNAGINVDLWPASRIAHFLDTDPKGQWLRKKYLGIEQELLSYELLKSLSAKNLDENFSIMFSDSKSLWVNRGLDEDIDQSLKLPLSLVVGESGSGKTIACFRKIRSHVKGGGIGIIIPHTVLSDALTLERAIFITLKKMHPALDHHSRPVLSFCSSNNPMIIVIEDVNRSNRPQDLIEKIIAWAKNIDKEKERLFHILCPVWPRNTALLEVQRKKDAEAYFVVAGQYTVEEAENAVMEKAKSNEIAISNLRAQEIAKALGYDPLLIALQDIRESPAPDTVIGAYINSALVKAEADDKSKNIASEYRDALKWLSGCMLTHKQFEVSWSRLKKWNELGSADLKAINFLARQGLIISYSGDPDDQVLLFRHDRVRDWLLSKYIKTEINSGKLEHNILCDPFYSELIGQALSDITLDEHILNVICQASPLSLFYALKYSSNLSQAPDKLLINAINSWVKDENNRSRAGRYMRWSSLYVLSETDSPEIPDIVGNFSENTTHGQLARLRNGDISGGVELCMHLAPGTGSPWRDVQIAHAKNKYVKTLAHSLNQLLENEKLSKAMRSGALRLAGHIGDESLADGALACWLTDKDREDHLDDYLWAFAQCWCEESEKMLNPVIDAWAKMPDESHDNMPSPRDELAAHHLRWAFRKWPPTKAIDYFIRQTEREELHWPITYMLHCVDHPQAVKFVVEELADTRRRLEGSDRFSPFVQTAANDWERSFEDGARRMSASTRNLLLDLWENENNDKHIRIQAFLIWCTSKRPEDTHILCKDVDLEKLQDSLIIERLKRGDHSAIPYLIDKVSQPDTMYWWQYGRYVWSEDLTQALDNFLKERRDKVPLEYTNSTDSDWIIAELIMALPERQAECILLKHWDHLRYSPLYIQAALYLVTPDSLKAATQTIEESSDPHKMLEHLSMHYGIKTIGRPGITKEKQIFALIPYFDYLSKHCIFSLWEFCNEKEWFELRREYLDSKLSEQYNRFLWNKSHVKTQLDDMVAGNNGLWIDFWVDSYIKTGVSWNEIFETLIEWLDNNLSEKALDLVVDAVAHRGSRGDSAVLDKYKNLSVAANNVIFDTKYRVCRRTLN